MSLIVAVSGAYQSYFDPKHMGTINPKKTYRPLPAAERERHKRAEAIKEVYKDDKKAFTSRKKLVYARDIMTSPVHTIEPGNSPNHGMHRMNRFGTHHLLVMDKGELVGIVSDRDLLRAIDQNGLSHRKIGEVMTEKVLLCKDKTDIRLVAKVMLEERISSIPVIDDNDVILGIITRSDLLEFIVTEMAVDILV